MTIFEKLEISRGYTSGLKPSPYTTSTKDSSHNLTLVGAYL